MKRSVLLLIILVTALFNSPVTAAPPLTVQINGSVVSAPVEMDIVEGQVMVPLRWAAEQLGADSVQWDPETRMVTIKTQQDFYNIEKLASYTRGLQFGTDEQNDIWPLPEKAQNLHLQYTVPNREWVLEFKSRQLNPTQLSDYITVNITNPDGSYEHSSVVYSCENHQDHYYLPMDWLEYLFNARVNYNQSTNILSIQTPAMDKINSQIALIEGTLVPATADEAVKLWGRGEQTRNGALQYAALSPQLRQEADKSCYVRGTYWVTGVSSPWVGPITIINKKKLNNTKIEYTLSFPEITSAPPNTTATEKVIVAKLPDSKGREGWFITQLLHSSGYGIIEGLDKDNSDMTDENDKPDFLIPEDFKNIKDNFYDLVNFDPAKGLLSFTIPEIIPANYRFYLHVSGRILMEDTSSGMSFHAFDEESKSYSWEKGKTYSYSLKSELLDDCLLVFGLQGINNQELLYTIHISSDGTKYIEE